MHVLSLTIVILICIIHSRESSEGPCPMSIVLRLSSATWILPIELELLLSSAHGHNGPDG